MGVSVVCTGTELLRGSTVNTNLAALGSELTSRGVRIDAAFTVGDGFLDICGALASALKISDVVVFIGGLGPTADDLTLEVAAKFFGLGLHTDAELKEKIEAFWKRLHQGRCPKCQYKQALLPDGGEAIPNPNGSACGIGFSAEYGQRLRHVFLLPGPPSEFIPMVRDHLADKLVNLTGVQEYVRGFLAAGVGESFASRLAEQTLGKAEPSLAYTANFEGTRVYLSGNNKDDVDSKFEAVYAAFGNDALPEGVVSLAPYLIEKLNRMSLTLSCAESCTGGMIAASLVDVPGSSSVFKGGVVAYDNSVKKTLLGVPESILENHGAVSKETAEAMVRGVAGKMESTCAIATTGIAGPGGGTPQKPVGLVYVAVLVNDRCEVREFCFRGDRNTVRSRAAAKGLLLLAEMLN